MTLQTFTADPTTFRTDMPEMPEVAVTVPARRPQYHFTGTYSDGVTRRWASETSEPETQVDWFTGGFLPFETVTYVQCPDDTMFCDC